MSRNLFGRWSAGLSAGDFAQAIAGVGVSDRPYPYLGKPADVDVIVKTRFYEHARLLPIYADAIVSLAYRHEVDEDFEKNVPPAGHYVKLWQTLIGRLRKGPGDLIRLGIIPDSLEEARHPAFPLDWLAKELGRPEVGASSVAVTRDVPGLEVGWNWPMRIGVLAGQASSALRRLLDGQPWPDLFDVVLANRGERECDLLLLDASLRGGLAQILGVSRRMTADCTVILGGAGADSLRSARLISSLRAEARTSGIAIADVDPGERSLWLETLLREIAHNMPLDVALWRAAAAAKAPQPYFEATAELLRSARLAETASRMAAHLEAVGDVPAAEAMAKVVREGAFLHEEDDATELANLRRKAESTLGARMRFAKKNGAPAPAPAAKAVEDERRVNFDLYDAASPGERVERKPLSRGKRYRIDVSIGFPRQDGGSADGAFPADKLPPGGHWLKIAFVPLTRDDHGGLAEPQASTTFLPAKGESKTCSFSFETVAHSGRFDARVIVAFGNRVVQTLVFSAGIERDPLPTLRIESVAATDLDQLAYRSHVDASLVVNHSPAGTPGATALADEEITYTELPNMEALVEDIRAALKQLAARKEPFKKLDDPELCKQLFKLAKSGRKLWREVDPKMRRLLADAGALQVIDARPGAYLPVEFFFEDALPGTDKKLCPKAMAFLDTTDTPHKECPHYGDTDYLCPLRFWGFQRVIERQAVYATDAKAGKFRLRSPTPVRPRIDAFRSALVGFSNKVLEPDQRRILDALQTKKVKKVAQAKDWDKWCKAVEANSPTLLVLLPHSARALDDKGKETLEEALEVGGKLLALDDFDEEHIAGPESPEPVVFLLGCSTNLVELPFANFVSYARKLKASLVVGTLAPVSGHRAAQFVTEMLDALAAGKNGSFGQAFLKVRRRLLANGNGFALALVAYGDVDWIV